MTPEMITAKAELKRMMDLVLANARPNGTSTTSVLLPVFLHDAMIAANERVRELEKIEAGLCPDELSDLSTGASGKP